MNKKINLFCNKGITLIEILMAVIVFGAVMSIVTPMIIQSFDIVEDSSVRITHNRLADLMLEDISNYFKSATNYENVNSGTYDFEAYSPQTGNENNYRIIYNSSNLELEFRENGNLLRKLTNVDDFNFYSASNPNSYLYILELSIINESGELIDKQLNLYARNISVQDDEN